MNEFMIEDHSVESQASAPIGGAGQDGVRIVPVEDLGLGVARLLQGGLSGLAALGKGDALAVAVKKTSDELTGVVNKAVQTVTGLVNRVAAPKE